MTPNLTLSKELQFLQNLREALPSHVAQPAEADAGFSGLSVSEVPHESVGAHQIEPQTEAQEASTPHEALPNGPSPASKP